MLDLAIAGGELEALAGEVLRAGCAVRFRARGASMWPSIRDGDVVKIQPMGSTAIRRGDVVLYYSGQGRLVAHRVANRCTQQGCVELLMQGDALTRPDGLVPQEQVLGRLVAIQRSGRCVRLDTPLYRALGLAWIRVAPRGRRLLRLLRTVWRRTRLASLSQ